MIILVQIKLNLVYCCLELFCASLDSRSDYLYENLEEWEELAEKQQQFLNGRKSTLNNRLNVIF